MVTLNRLNNSVALESQVYDSPLDSSYDNYPVDEYVTDMGDDYLTEEGYEFQGSGRQLPALNAGEYAKQLQTQAQSIRNNDSLSSAEKNTILNRINKLMVALKRIPDQSYPPAELLSEVEGFLMEQMELEARTMEESNALSEELYARLDELRSGVEATEGSGYSLTEDQRKDYLTQINQMMHSLDLGETPEALDQKLEDLEKKLSEFATDEKTQAFLNLFTEPPTTVQELKDAGIFEEVKNNHGEMPSEKVIQFMADRDGALKGIIANEDTAAATERVSTLLNEGFGIETFAPEEEKASQYSVDKKDHLIQLGSKVYELKISDKPLKFESADELSEEEQASEAIADKLANLQGVYDIKAGDILARAKEFNIDLANLPASPTPNMINFFISLDKGFANQIANFIGAMSHGKNPSDGDYAAIRDRMVEFMKVLYPDAVTRKDGSGRAVDNIIFRGADLDIINQDNWKAARGNPALLFDFGGDYSSGPGHDSIFDGMAKGAVAGATGGAILGTIFGPGGTAFGAAVGGAVGGFVGGAIDAVEDLFDW